MLNSISFMGHVNPISKTTGAQAPIKTSGDDCFVRSASPLDKSKADAKAKIIDVLKQENLEYSFTIAPNGTVLDENKGTEGACSIDSRKVVKNSVLMHGHPVPLPLSSGDIASLLATDAISDEAITVDGKYSRLIKNESYKIDKDYRDLYFELEQQLCLKALDNLGIDYQFREADLIDMFKDYLETNMCKPKDSTTDEDAKRIMSQLDISCDEDKLDESRKQLEQMMYFQLMSNPHKYDKKHNTIVENYPLVQEFLNSPDGIKVRHEFCRDVAKQFNMTYETNLE